MLVAEIERQLSFARRQAKKAETYKVVKAELGELEQLAAARRIIDQREELGLQTSRDAELKTALESARAGAATMRDQSRSRVIERAIGTCGIGRCAART